MKIICEFDWVGEDDSIDSAVQKEIMNAVVQNISKKFSNEMFKEVEEAASKELATKVNKLCEELLDRFSNKEILVTDGWGDIQSKHESVSDLLKSKFDKFLTQKVDRNGKVSSGYCSRDDYTRLDFVLDKRIKEESDKLTKQIVSEVDVKLKAKAAEMHTELVEQITKKLGLNV